MLDVQTKEIANILIYTVEGTESEIKHFYETIKKQYPPAAYGTFLKKGTEKNTAIIQHSKTSD